MLTVGSLFSGIGGFDLGFERAGMRTLWFCERDPFCQRVLADHWPDVPCYPDVTKLEGGGIPRVDVLCGGFPCQDISLAGKGAGIDGERSGLWSEYARLIGELRPRYVVVENVAALLARGMGRVLGDLAALGYDAEWDCIPASAVGAPHRRDRLWIVAYPDAGGRGTRLAGVQARQPDASGRCSDPDTDSGGREVGAQQDERAERPEQQASRRDDTHRFRGDVADAAPLDGENAERQPGSDRGGSTEAASRGCGSGGGAQALADPEVEPVGTGLRADEQGTLGRRRPGDSGSAHYWWSVEPDVGRVADGVPARVDRLRSLGNSLVPQIAEWIGERIVSYEAERVRAAA